MRRRLWVEENEWQILISEVMGLRYILYLNIPDTLHFSDHINLHIKHISIRLIRIYTHTLILDFDLSVKTHGHMHHYLRNALIPQIHSSSPRLEKVLFNLFSMIWPRHAQ